MLIVDLLLWSGGLALAYPAWDLLAAARRDGQQIPRDWRVEVGLELGLAALCCWSMLVLDASWRLATG